MHIKQLSMIFVLFYYTEEVCIFSYVFIVSFNTETNRCEIYRTSYSFRNKKIRRLGV